MIAVLNIFTIKTVTLQKIFANFLDFQPKTQFTRSYGRIRIGAKAVE